MHMSKELILMELLRKTGWRSRLAERPPMDGRPGTEGAFPEGGRPCGPRGFRPPMDGDFRGPMGFRPPMDGDFPGDRRPPRGPHGPMGHRPPMPAPMPRERILLAVLKLGGEGARQKDIAEALGIGAPALSEQLDRLEADRYIERKVNPADRRSTLISLTEKGQARAFEVQDERAGRARAFCAGLTEEEIDTLTALLRKLLEGQAQDR